MTPIELMSSWHRTGKVPELNHDELRRFYDTLEQLAKLLATEDITVNFFSSALAGKAANGMFDPVTRVLYIAPFDDDMLHTLPGITVHEVSHALFTVVDDEVKTFMDKYGVPDIWNIIEDGYCERKVCLKYSGVKKYLKMRFDVIFLPMWPMKSVDFLTDTTNALNYNCKALKYGYARQQYSDDFTADEIKQLHDAENCNDERTMDRIERSISLMKMLLAADKRRNTDNQPKVTPPASEDGKSETQPQQSIPSDENEAEPTEPSTDTSDVQNEEPPSDAKSDATADDHAEEPVDGTVDEPDDDAVNAPDDVLSDDEALQQFSEEVDSKDILDEDRQLVSMRKDTSSDIIYRLATPEQLKIFCESHDILELIKHPGVGANGLPKGLSSEKKYQIITRLFGKHSIQAQNVAQLLFRRFVAKANAENLKRVSYRTSGVLDPLRMTQYQYVDDIFQQVRIQPNQVNHGFVLMLDWSGSMQQSTTALVYRVMELTHFAILAKVDLEVWLYTDRKNKDVDKMLENCKGIDDIIVNPAKIIHVLSTRKHAPQQCAMRLFNLFFASHVINSNWHIHEMFPKLSKDDKQLLVEDYRAMIDQRGTTITEAAIFAIGRLQGMRCQKKSLLIMTDGDDNDFSLLTTKSDKHKTSQFKIPFDAHMNGGEYGSVASVMKSTNILMNGVSIHKIIAQSLEKLSKQLIQDGVSQLKHDTIIATTVMKPRAVALRAVIDTLRRKGVMVTSLGWQLSDDKMNDVAFLFSLGGEVINIKQDLSNNASRTRHIGRYAQVDNRFIDELSARLLGD